MRLHYAPYNTTSMKDLTLQKQFVGFVQQFMDLMPLENVWSANNLRVSVPEILALKTRSGRVAR